MIKTHDICTTCIFKIDNSTAACFIHKKPIRDTRNKFQDICEFHTNIKEASSAAAQFYKDAGIRH